MGAYKVKGTSYSGTAFTLAGENAPMTPQPSEEAIRKACEEAGLDYSRYDAGEYHTGTMDALLALARRIEAEREAVPVAWQYDHHKGFSLSTSRQPNLAKSGWTETPLYAAPPKEPTK